MLLSTQEASIDDMNSAEEPVLTALVSLVLKLSEASFRPSGPPEGLFPTDCRCCVDKHDI